MKNTFRIALVIAIVYYVLFSMIALLLLGGYTGIFGAFALLGGIPGSLTGMASFFVLHTLSRRLFREHTGARSVAGSVAAMLSVALAFAASVASIVSACDMEGFRL